MNDARADHPMETAHRAQRVFRAVLMAMARPGRIEDVSPYPASPAGLDPTQAAVLLTLADFETPVWLDAALAGQRSITEFIRFHTGAPVVQEPAKSAFALISDPARMPPLSAFAQGEPEYPDRSTTLIVRVAELGAEGLRLRGPGIDGATGFGFAPRPPSLLAELGENRMRFPLGVDLILVGDERISALPRSAIVVEDPTCT